MKCLVTGGLGYIGSHFVVEAIKEGFEPVIIDNLSNTSTDVLAAIEKIANKQIKFYQVDLLDIKSVDNIFKREDFECIVHFAGLKAVADSTIKPLEYYQNNVVGTLNLLQVMKQHQVNNFVFSSSATVYGFDNSVPYVETQPKKPVNPYGRTKAIIEDVLEDACRANPSFSAIALRYFNPIGAHASGLIGDSPLGTPNNLLPYITRVANKHYAYLNVYGFDYDTRDGTGIRDYIHVIDLVNGHIKALNYQKNNSGFEVFNLGNSAGYSVLEIIKAFEEVNHLSVPYKFKERRPGDIDAFWACSQKAKTFLNWQPRLELADMVKDAWFFETLNTSMERV